MTHTRPPLSEADTSQIIAMAWDDNTPFEAIAQTYGLSESEVIALMRQSLKTGSFRVWRTRVRGRASKHQARQNQQAVQTLAQACGVVKPMGEDLPTRTTYPTREGLK
ncbi:TIGR03643 family protein [Limnohabitans sp. Bal53]|uniref:TIGR03643 family protein n=1 Tax=Limnohabitans sp. Bal53 TaxID=1977910 RepID=UPI000D3C224D|nr:TIGR03643 family protein [Limnohabitans sp. Bal53]PUE41250.1 TIGR03643 family protein [Limnohabitans sp. Bal53]